MRWTVKQADGHAEGNFREMKKIGRGSGERRDVAKMDREHGAQRQRLA